MWLPIHTELPRHIKVRRFAKELGVPLSQAVGHLVMLWLWALENASDGDLGVFSYPEICEGAGWRGRDKGKFITALMEAGLVDLDNRIHDWDDYAGNLLAKRERDRLRKREERRRTKAQTETLQAIEDEERYPESYGRPFL